MERPIILAPVSSQRAFHPGGGNRRRARGPIEGAPADALDPDHRIDRGRECGAGRTRLVPALRHYGLERDALDGQAGRGGRLSGARLHRRSDSAATNRETLRRFERQDTRDCRVCHDRSNLQTLTVRRPMFSGFDLAGVAMQPSGNLGLCQATQGHDPMRLAIKGIVTREDAALAVSNGVDAHRLFEPRRARRGDWTVVESRASRKSWKAPRDACRSSSTAVSGVARTFSRPSRSAPPPSAWGDRMCGAWRLWPGGRRNRPRHPHTGTPAGDAIRGNTCDSNITRAHVVERR